MDWVALITVILSTMQQLWPVISKWFGKPAANVVANLTAAQLQREGKQSLIQSPNDLTAVAAAMRKASDNANPLIRVIMKKLATHLDRNSAQVWNQMVQTGQASGTTVELPPVQMAFQLPVHQDLDDLLVQVVPHLPDSVLAEELPMLKLGLSSVITFVAETANVQSVLRLLPTSWLKIIMGWIHASAAPVTLNVSNDSLTATTMPDELKLAILAALKQLAGTFSNKPVVQLVLNAFINYFSGYVLDAVWNKIVAYLTKPATPTTPADPATPSSPAAPANPPVPANSDSITPATPITMATPAEDEVLDHVNIVGLI